MGRKRKTPDTDEGREHQLISSAMDLAEKQINEGTASSQVLTHFLKLGSEREKLERDRLRSENRMLQARVEALASAKRVEELYAEALMAMRSYAGQPPPEEYFDEDEDDYYRD